MFNKKKRAQHKYETDRMSAGFQIQYITVRFNTPVVTSYDNTIKNKVKTKVLLLAYLCNETFRYECICNSKIHGRITESNASLFLSSINFYMNTYLDAAY